MLKGAHWKDVAFALPCLVGITEYLLRAKRRPRFCTAGEEIEPQVSLGSCSGIRCYVRS